MDVSRRDRHEFYAQKNAFAKADTLEILVFVNDAIKQLSIRNK